MNQDTIYKTFARVTSRIRSHATLKDGEPVGFVFVHYPADGAGRVKAFLHLYGLPMAYGWASGYGYDKATTAVYSAIKSMTARSRKSVSKAWGRAGSLGCCRTPSRTAAMTTSARWRIRV